MGIREGKFNQEKIVENDEFNPEGFDEDDDQDPRQRRYDG